MWIWLRQINRARCYKDKTLNLWSEIIDSKTLNYHRTNPREYQIVITHTKETTWIQDPTSPNHQKHPVQDASSKQQTRQKFKPIISRQDYHLTQSCPSEEKETNKQKLSTNLTLYEAYTNHWTNIRRAETKRKKDFHLLQGKNSTCLEAWEKETSNTVI